jgi:predicted ATPase with chaperone activity
MKPFAQEAPRLELIAGHEYEKRAIEIALIGNHPVCFLISKGSEIPQLLMTANRIANELQIPFKGLAYFWCPCGNYGSQKDECECKYPVIERHLRKLAKQVTKYDIWSQSTSYPKQYHNGEVEEDVVERIVNAREFRNKNQGGDDEPMTDLSLDSESRGVINQYQKVVSAKVDVGRVKRLAKTIAYADDYNHFHTNKFLIQLRHVIEALQYQPYTMASLQGILE